jgi:hypothetical protein
MNFKLALAAAAVVGLAGTAQAADLAKKAPAAANYVKVCDAYGAGFFYIPGSDTCLKIGGFVRFQATAFGPSRNWNTTHGGAFGWQRGQNGIATLARADLQIDARTNTELGLLRSFMEILSDSYSYSAGGNTNTYMNAAYIQFAGLTAGRAQSFFDFITGSSGPFTLTSTATMVPDARVNLLAYTFSFGNGITASLSIEDPSTSSNSNPYASSQALRRSPYDTTSGGYGGVHTPDLIAALNVTQAWGSAQLSGVLHDDAPGASGVTGKLGWAVLGGVKVNLPMLAAGDVFGIQGVYSQGATGYALTAWQGGSAVTTRDFYTNAVGTGIDQTNAYSVYAALTHNWSKTLASTLGAGFGGMDQVGTNLDYKVYDVRANLGWKPVAGFAVTGEVTYNRVDYRSAAISDSDRVNFDLRIQRNF